MLIVVPCKNEEAGTIGLLYYDPSAAFVAGVQQGATLRCREAGRHLVVESLQENGTDVAAQIESMLAALRPDGMILTPPLCDDPVILATLRASRTPCVLISPADLISAWVALDDVTLETGCLRFVPGSHRWGVHRGLGTEEDFAPRYDPAQLPDGAEVRVECVEVRKGECNFHHCLTWHGSAPNPTDHHRRAIAIHYMPAHIRYTAAGNHPMKPRVTVADGEILEGEYFPTVYRK